MWNIYYHLYLDEETARVLQTHLVRLLAASSSLQTWKESEFGEKFRFVTVSTLPSVRRLWHACAESLGKEDQDQCRADFDAALEYAKNEKDSGLGGLNFEGGGARGAAPIGIQGLANEGVKIALDSWWETGTYDPVPANTDIPNPLFAAWHSGLHYAGNPILSYHLTTAKAHLTENSPLGSESGSEDPSSFAIIAAAQAQFAKWSQAFTEMASGNMTLRYIAANSLSLCQTLQHHLGTGQPSGHFYRRQLTMERLELDPDEYGTNSNAPKQFDVIDTSILSEFLGTLNIIVSSSPLLKPVPWATLYTRTVDWGMDWRTEKKQTLFEELLFGPIRTVATLLGISPVEYWTNATAVLSVAEHLHDGVKPAVQWRLAWKFHEHWSGQTGQMLRLKVKDDIFVNLIQKVYRAMFAMEDLRGVFTLSQERSRNMMRKFGYPAYHRGSLVAFVRRLLQTVDVPEEVVCQMFLAETIEDSTSMLGYKFKPSFYMEMCRQGLYTLQQSIQRGPDAPLFSRWSEIPEAVAVTIAIPEASWKKVVNAALDVPIIFAVEAGIRGVQDGVQTWQDSIYSDVQVTFGTASTVGNRQGEELTVFVAEDRAAWSGDSDLIATFSVSAETLQMDTKHTKVGLYLHDTPMLAAPLTKKLPELGTPMRPEPMIIYETNLEDNDRVYITKNQPGQEGFPLYNNLAPTATQDTTGDHKSSFTADIDFSGVLNTITGRLDILSPDGQRLLADKAAVDVRKISPFTFEIVLGQREAVYPLCFPVPVVKDGSKTKVARASGYVEVTAPVAEPASSQTLDDFIFPSTLAKTGSSSGDGLTIPVPLNIPHVNLDNLPVLDISDKKRLGFLTTLTSRMFSTRERKLRDQADDTGLAPSARMNFKESLFTMFMLASGLQGGQTGLFAIHHPEKGGIHMLLFVSAIRLDGANTSVALDAAVIPFTVDIIRGGRLEAFLLILRELECCTITVDDEELVLWKKVLPALAERCRTWTHAEGCEYARPGAAVPLSTEPGEQVLCSCGAGKLPEGFIGLPEWDVASQFATRIAISPVYAMPFVEDVIDPSMDEGMSKLGLGVQGDETLRCRNCGDVEAKGGGALKKCMRCLKVRYCSAECQKKDWKKHRMECSEAEEKWGPKP